MKQWLADSDMPPSLSSERIGRVPNRNLKFLVEQKHPNVDLTKKTKVMLVLSAERMKFFFE